MDHTVWHVQQAKNKNPMSKISRPHESQRRLFYPLEICFSVESFHP